jgi:signal transduction histidine kinase
MQRLLDDLLSYAQLSDNLPEPQEIDLNVIVNTAMTDLEILSKEKNASFEIGPLPKIKGISFQLYQLFLNLLSNALKFSKNTEPPFITVSSSEVSRDDLPKLTFSNTRKYHHITVKDNGEGFEEEHAEKIFEVFQQLKTSSGSTGSGIGLSIVKKVAQNHHGLVTAESTPTVGTTFHIYLPAD